MSIELYRYELRLASPISLRGATLAKRTGFLVRLERRGVAGWGEAAPLPGFSAESDQEIFEVLLRMRQSKALEFEAWVDCPACVRFALESADLEIRSKEESKSMAEMLSSGAASTIEVNALVVETGERAVKEARRAFDAGFRTIKLKVGSAGVPADVETVRAILRSLPEEVAIRLDANQAWSFEDACRFAAGTEMTRIEYVEEPLADTRRLRELVEQTGMPIALDESLVGIGPEDLADLAHVRALVLKPSISGGLDWVIRMAGEAKRLGTATVISSAFESGVGLRVHSAIAAALSETACGLGTYRFLAEDVFDPRLAIDGPILDVEAILEARTPDLRKLEAIP